MINGKNTGQASHPIAVVDAGDLVSHLHRTADEMSPNIYRYTIFRFHPCLKVTHGLRPCDLRDIVKLCQVLAFAMTDDGWLPHDAHNALLAAYEDLDELTRNWGQVES